MSDTLTETMNALGINARRAARAWVWHQPR